MISIQCTDPTQVGDPSNQLQRSFPNTFSLPQSAPLSPSMVLEIAQIIHTWRIKMEDGCQPWSTCARGTSWSGQWKHFSAEPSHFCVIFWLSLFFFNLLFLLWLWLEPWRRHCRL